MLKTEEDFDSATLGIEERMLTVAVDEMACTKPLQFFVYNSARKRSRVKKKGNDLITAMLIKDLPSA
ncbi:Hypothetical predicted protein [Olea europaea subsp. europaea]|uniref:Uncharacterized protein n=1 Tax=Olea europaea subsp. europaea TaxID=158383 RepID=A0A8S0SS24_OLEEU|nr:Hypothetical predicted protein [Olea europaea subsp. europaea]